LTLWVHGFAGSQKTQPGQGIGKDPAGVRQDSPGRKPWEPRQVPMSALDGRCRPLQLFQVGILAGPCRHASRAGCWPHVALRVRGSSSSGAERRLKGTLDTVGAWFCRLSENAPGQEIGKDPAGVRQDSPGRKPWELRQVRMSALNGRCRPLRLFQVGILAVHVTMARAPVFPARPFQGRCVGDSPGARIVA